MKINLFVFLIVLYAFAAIAIASDGDLPPESSLPTRRVANKVGNSLNFPSESILPAKTVSSSNGQQASSSDRPSTATATNSKLPSESELPKEKTAASKVQETTPFEKLEIASRGDLESELLKEEGETTPWPRLIQDGHTAAVTSMVFAPDGSALYTAGRDKLVHVWVVDETQKWTHRDTVRWQVGRGPGGNISSLLSTNPFLFLGGYGIKAGREIGVIDRNVLTTLSPLLNTADLNARDTESLLDFSIDDESKVVAADSQGGLVRWDFSRLSGKWNATRLREGSSQRTRYAPLARMGKSQMVISEKTAGRNEEPYQLAILDVRDGKKLESLKQEASAADGPEVLGAMIEDLEKGTGRALVANEKMELIKKVIPAAGKICTSIACSPSGKFVLALDDAGWLVLWQSGKGMIQKYRQNDVVNGVVQGDSFFSFTSIAWSDSDSTFFVGENAKKTGRGRIQKWTVNSKGQFRVERVADLERPPFHLTTHGKRIANDNGPQIQIRNGNDLSLESELGRNSFRAPKQIQWSADGNIAWKWSDISGAEQAMGIEGNSEGELRLQLIDPKQRSWAAQPTVIGGELPKYDPSRNLTIQTPTGLKATLDLDLVRGETIATRYGQISASCWVLDSNRQPSGIAVSFLDGAEIWVFGFPQIGERVCPLRRVFRGHEDTINALQCSSDGRYLISSCQDRRMCIWPLVGWDAARDALLDPIARWGIKAEIGADAVEIAEVAPEGPLYARGLRSGDRIVKLAWTEPDPNSGILKAASTEVPNEIWQRMSRANFLTNFAFWAQRGGRDAPRFGFKRVCQWEPILTVAVNADREWAAWTPLGFYDASINGDRLFGWQLNRGPDKRPDFMPANRFRASLERPDVIGKLLVVGNIAKAFEKVGVQIPGGPNGVLSSLIALQPTVEILAPAVVSSSLGNQVRLRAAVRMQRGQSLSATRAYVNGVVASNYRLIGPSKGTIDPADSDSRLYIAEWDASIPSDPRLKFQVFVETAEHNVGVGELILKQDLEKKESPRANIYVVTAGVSQYRDPSLNLNRSSVNAKRIAEALANNAIGASGSQVSVLTDAMVTPVAWRSAIETLAERLAGNVSPDDLVLVYLTGHGLIDPSTREYHFVTGRAWTRDLRAAKYEDCLSMTDLEALRKVACRKLVILDTCHSGAAQTQSPSHLKLAVRSLQSDQIFVMTASDGNQLAYEDAFTDPLKEALDGLADVNQDRYVSLQEAFQYVKENMRKQAKPQFPTLGPLDLVDFANFSIVRTTPPAKLTGMKANR